MKTIEERAYDYAKVTTWDDIDGYPSDIYATNAYNAYVEGAKEQKAIDIDKVCDWLKARNVLTDASLDGFRKAMEG